jgi:hypothetical protein
MQYINIKQIYNYQKNNKNIKTFCVFKKNCLNLPNYKLLNQYIKYLGSWKIRRQKKRNNYLLLLAKE